MSFAPNLKPTDKFDTRAKRCILLGYPFGYKGYKLYDLDTKKVFYSRDVLFHENVFPVKGDPTHIGNVNNDSYSSLQSYPLFPPHTIPTHYDYISPTSDIMESPLIQYHEPANSSSGSLSQSLATFDAFSGFVASD